MAKETSARRPEFDLARQGCRVEHALGILGTTAAKLAEKAGVQQDAVKMAVYRRSARCGWLEDVLPAIPDDVVSHDWLRSGRGPVPTPLGNASGKQLRATPATADSRALAAVAPSKYRVPRLALTSVGLGRGRVEWKVGGADEYARTFSAATLSEVPEAQRKALVFEEMPDESMVPYLMPDEAFVINPFETALVPGRLYGIACGNRTTVRRAREGAEGPELPLDSTDDPAVVAAAGTSVLGRVVARAGAPL
jgi:hypothetical protein